MCCLCVYECVHQLACPSLLYQLVEHRGTRAACMCVCVCVCIQLSLPGGSGCVQLAGWNLVVAPKGWPHSHGFPLNLAALWLPLPCPISVKAIALTSYSLSPVQSLVCLLCLSLLFPHLPLLASSSSLVCGSLRVVSFNRLSQRLCTITPALNPATASASSPV